MAPDGGLTFPDTGSPWPRAEGRLWAGREYARPVESMNMANWLLLPLAAILKASPDLYCKEAGSTSWPFAARIQPRSDNTIVTGSVEINSVWLNAFASSL